ncbi:MAG: hypothetical protein L0H39_02530, partial [Brachybacterium sp.]|nr:hypothetical protein [Brachybacterium sp.]
VAAGAVIDTHTADGTDTGSPSAESADPADDTASGDALGADVLFGASGQESREESVWSLGSSSSEEGASGEDDASADAPAEAGPAADADDSEDDTPAGTGTSAAEDRTEQIDVVDDDEEQR